MERAEQAYIRVVEEHPWLLKLPIASEDLKIAIAAGYLVGELDGMAEMKAITDRVLAAWGTK